MFIFSCLFDFAYASTGLYISVPPSFMLSRATPLLYVLAQAAVEALPASSIPMPTFTTELPLAFLDGFTHAILLCTLSHPPSRAASFQNSQNPLGAPPRLMLKSSPLPSHPNHNFENE